MKTTHIEKVRVELATVKMQAQNVLGWDDLQYGQFQEEMGRKYLEHFGSVTSTLREPQCTAPVDDPFLEEITRSKTFWSWWRLHWLERDREFIEISCLLRTGEMEPYYRDLHQPGSVAFRPHSKILEDTYTQMMHKLVKEAVNEK